MGKEIVYKTQLCEQCGKLFNRLMWHPDQENPSPPVCIPCLDKELEEKGEENARNK